MKRLLSGLTKAVTKFKDKQRSQQEKLNGDVLNYFDAVETLEHNRNSVIPKDKTALMKNSIKDEMSTFFLDTSFTALTQIYKANSLWKRVVLTILVIVMLALMTVQCYWLLEKYYRYPVEVNMDLKVSKELEFPSVTICNLNPILASKVCSDPYTPLIKYVKPDNDDTLYKETRDNWNYNQNCDPDDYKCNNGICVNQQFVCNGVQDCKNSNDEKYCEDYLCPNYMWKCTFPPKCIHLDLRCDGYPGDCHLSTVEDENDCENATCPDGTFRCNSGRCTNSEWECDKTSNCADDELNCSEQNKTNGNIRNEEIVKNPNGPFEANAMFQKASFNKWKVLENVLVSSNFYKERDDGYEAAMTYAYITSKLTPSVVEQSGHLKFDLIASCKFGGYQCSPMNFTYFHSHKFGNCYTFNSKVSNNRILTTRFPGPVNGLRLELFLDQRNYVANLAPEAGARILVHKKGTMPFPEDEGISIMPGRSTSVGIRQISLSRLPHPHGSCGDTGNTMEYYGRYLGTDYSKLACLKSCYQDMAIKYCGCAVPFYYVPSNVTVCNMTDRKIEHCINSLPCDHSESYTICDALCPVSCTETKYELTVSSAIWPSKKYKSCLEKKLGQTNYLYRSIKDSGKEFTKLQIYFQDLTYQEVKKERAYEAMNLMSDFGGQFGLWLGLSVITLGEICSFLFGVGRSLFLKFWGNKSRPIQNDLTTRVCIKASTLEEMFEEMCPEAAKYSPPEMTTSLPGSTGT